MVMEVSDGDPRPSRDPGDGRLVEARVAGLPERGSENPGAGFPRLGVGGAPGGLFSNDPKLHYYFGAHLSAVLGMFCNLPGWACLFIAQIKLAKGYQSENPS